MITKHKHKYTKMDSKQERILIKSNDKHRDTE